MFADDDQNSTLEFEEFLKFASINRKKMGKALRDLDRSGSGNADIYRCFGWTCCLCTLGASWIPYCVWKRSAAQEQRTALKNSLIEQKQS